MILQDTPEYLVVVKYQQVLQKQMFSVSVFHLLSIYELNIEVLSLQRRILNESRNFHVRFWLNIVFCISAYQVDDLSQVGVLVCLYHFGLQQGILKEGFEGPLTCYPHLAPSL